MPRFLFVLFFLFVTLGYGGACWLKPFTHCDRCKGHGVAPSGLSDRLRYGARPEHRAVRGLPNCPRCRGTGLRLRIGRRAYNHLTRIYREGTR